MSFKKNIPNLITILRFPGAVSLLFLDVLSPLYFIVYTATGFTDILDGFLARKMNLKSSLGTKLDSAADLLFYSISIMRLLPILIKILPPYIWFIVGAIILCRFVSYIISAVRFRKFASHHTLLNKITGVFVFLLPYMLITPIKAQYCFAVCIVGILSTVEDLYIHITSKEYSENIISAFTLNQ